MAIKGKKKSQSRGSQGVRRPARAPRAPVAARRRTPWYKTPQGRAALIVLLLVVAGVVTALVLHAKSNSDKLAKRQEALERYTGSVRAVLQTLTPPASEMATAPTDATDLTAVSALEKSSKTWKDTIKTAVDEGTALRPTEEAANANAMFRQSAVLYLTAAQLYALVPSESVTSQTDVLNSATTVRDQASELWSNAISLLDTLRADLDMRPSGLRSPSVTPPGAVPTPSAIATTAPGAGSGGAGGGGGGGGGKNKGSKNGK